MLKRTLFIGLLAASCHAFGQSIASLNFRYLYDPQNEINFPIKAINERNKITVYYSLQLNNPQDAAKNYVISWERRDSYIQTQGTRVRPDDSTSVVGRLSFPTPEKPWLLVAKIVNAAENQRWIYFQLMKPKHPIDGYIESDEGMVFAPYVKMNREYTFHGSQQDKPLHVFLYKTDFPAASPPFGSADIPDRFMFTDSTFHVANGAKVLLKSRGLYLVQQDTASTFGFAFRVVGNSFPKHNKVEDIPPPLVFVSTKEEHDEMIAARGDKSKIDKVILDITQSTERAKNFMRNYFRKVELDNIYFSTYKEGWKTDRGMLYLIYGLPDEVSRPDQDTETWFYKINAERFVFKRAPGVYDPQYFTLLRSSQFMEDWYKSIDNWRKSRF